MKSLAWVKQRIMAKKMKELMPLSKEITVASKQLMPPGKEITAASKQLMPPSKEIMAASKQLMPLSKEIMAASKQLTVHVSSKKLSEIKSPVDDLDI